MKANIETLEPIVRPIAATQSVRTTQRASRRLGFTPIRAEAALFHAWRA